MQRRRKRFILVGDGVLALSEHRALWLHHPELATLDYGSHLVGVVSPVAEHFGVEWTVNIGNRFAPDRPILERKLSVEIGSGKSCRRARAFSHFCRLRPLEKMLNHLHRSHTPALSEPTLA